MARLTSYWLLPFGLVSELGGAVALFTGEDSVRAVGGYVVAHALSCVVFTLALLVLMPQRYRKQRWRPAVFLFSLQFAIPLVGSLGVFVGILLALYLPRSNRELPWQQVPIPELPFRPTDMGSQVVYTEGGLRQVLREASDPGKRLKALLASRQMEGREGVDILREALKDPVDDVRLLAYSMLEQKEKALVQEAERLQSQVTEAADPKSLERMNRRLAQTWWETAYLGLAQGSLRQYYLEKSRDLLVKLVATYDEPSDWQLLGRVELALGRPEEARDAFELAIDNGARQEHILPYLAEIAFLARDYQRVRFYLARCAHGHNHPAITPLLEAWL
ncbi:MAG TPA: polysaccharide biosynthesis protein [Marinobacter hydrocarbonoclasticus]|uniref:tetratricopeptide repeat protein n=1 Tax=Marinobacter TaxID=2742 RepID=UPI000320EBC9|nr:MULTISPECIES: polysaccharide biosynthesis protein [Marinobacter]MBY5938269.1 polysaccharide biosynthesis protein [Marinobacter nauticus]MBY5955498.1 polysaccharide biosynthesis protein [Marinobacter nauticus]MBY6009289.1 polysaccharide biosynthesis protein [Marinobacter nauticus]HAX10835.1 polysaccharide biosynthesis protein [Marinobacter nauticus]HCL37462.1 polysaccharide biosynthesis protein [Marinobacter nauticus]